MIQLTINSIDFNERSAWVFFNIKLILIKNSNIFKSLEITVFYDRNSHNNRNNEMK